MQVYLSSLFNFFTLLIHFKYIFIHHHPLQYRTFTKNFLTFYLSSDFNILTITTSIFLYSHTTQELPVKKNFIYEKQHVKTVVVVGRSSRKRDKKLFARQSVRRLKHICPTPCRTQKFDNGQHYICINLVLYFCQVFFCFCKFSCC